jgi:hypothetical protein
VFAGIPQRACEVVANPEGVVVGLYLCVFAGDEELEGVEVGGYVDFDFFRSAVTELLERGLAGLKYPTLIIHSDSDGEWSPAECARLKLELTDIATEFASLPSRPFQADWQKQVGKLLGLKPTTLYDSLIDVDGEPLIGRLQRLCEVAIENDEPILFQ